MKKYTSLEHAIRQAVADQNYNREKPVVEHKPHLTLEHSIRNIHEGIAPNDSDKYLGVPAPFLRGPGQGKQQERVDNLKQNQTASNSRNAANEFPINNMKRGRIGDVKEAVAKKKEEYEDSDGPTPMKVPAEQPSGAAASNDSSTPQQPANQPAPDKSNWGIANKIGSYLDPYNPLLAKGQRNPQTGDYEPEDPEYQYGAKDLAADVGTFVPGVGTAAAGYSAKRDFNRGEYGTGVLDAAMMIPGLGTVGKAIEGGAKLALKGGEGAEKAEKLIKGTDAAEKAVKDGEVAATDAAKGGEKAVKAGDEVVKTGDAASKEVKGAEAAEKGAKWWEKVPALASLLGGGGAAPVPYSAGAMPIAQHGPVKTSTSQTSALNQLGTASRSMPSSFYGKKIGATRAAPVKEEMGDIGGVSTQQNISYSEDGNKKVIKELGIGTDKFGGRPGSSYFKSVHISPENTKSALKISGERKVNKQEHSPTIKGKIKEDSTVPNEGNAQSMADLSASGAPTEDGGKTKSKKKTRSEGMELMGGQGNESLHFEDGRKMKKRIKEESEGTRDRTSIENVARPKSAKSPFDRTSKLAKQGEIKRKIIDENAERLHTIKGVIADKKQQNATKTPVEFNPKMKKPDVDTDVVGSSA